MSTTTARFSCPACGKSYKWKTELAGRKVKCTCGHVMKAPEHPPRAVEEEEDLIPLADEQRESHAPAGGHEHARPSHHEVGDHTVHGHQLMEATAAGTAAIAAPPESAPPPASPRGQPTPKPRAVVHVNAGQLLGSHIKHEEPQKSSNTSMYVAIGLLLAAAAIILFLMLR